MTSSGSLSSLIWSSADDVLRGLFKPSEYGRVILPFLVMRRLDCVLEHKKEEIYSLYRKYKGETDDYSPLIEAQIKLPFFNVSRFDLYRLKSEPTNILKNFDDYVQGYSKNILELIDNFGVKSLVNKLERNNRLYLYIENFTKLDLHPSKIDNHEMGSVYEELLRRFSEMSNEVSGDHFTPRDVVRLLVSIVLGGDIERLSQERKKRSVFDPCCGTGGMLTLGKDWINENVNCKPKIDLYGQELNDVTYAICKSDFLMMNENPENIRGPYSSLSDDSFRDCKFDYMITNPPFGVSWKSEKSRIIEESKNKDGRFCIGTPRSSDGSLLFLQSLIHKMKPEGSRIGIVFNSSPLFTGDAGSGESDIRKWIFENDWLECILQLPEKIFFNTSIQTYIWILANNKSKARKGKVQLINGEKFFTKMKRNFGEKNKYISQKQCKELFEIYERNKECEYCKIYPNSFFGYTKVLIEQPVIINGIIDRGKSGLPKIDARKRDYERIPLSEDIDEYYNEMVKPNLPNAWMDRSKEKVGFEINFTKYFYKFEELKEPAEISKELKALEEEINLLTLEINNG